MSTIEQNQPQFVLQRIYLKDASFEVPHAPEIFLTQWEPKIDINLETFAKNIGENTYESLIFVSVTASVDDKIAFIAEVKQAGIFSIANIPEDQINPILNITCANIIFPFLRSALCDLIVKGSFPQFLIDPINFEVLYQQQVENQAITTETTH
ncbi:MAG: Protein-export protein SecB [Legionellaceae bacterium]